MIIIFQALGITAALAFLVYLFRASAIIDERVKILEQIKELAREDWNKGQDWHWRLDKFNEIDMVDMLLAFWKPVKSYYADNECLNKKLQKEN